MLRTHYAAFKDHLAEPAMLADKVETTVRITNDGSAVRANYVVAFPGGPDQLDDERFMTTQAADSKADFSYDVRVVAVDGDGCLLLADEVIGQMVGTVLDVSGRTCTAVQLDAAESSRVTFDRTARLFYLDLTFQFTSQRSA